MVTKKLVIKFGVRNWNIYVYIYGEETGKWTGKKDRERKTKNEGKTT